MNNLAGMLLTAILALIVVGLPVSCTVHANNKIADMVSKGADPIEAACALGSGNDRTLCALAAATKKNR